MDLVLHFVGRDAFIVWVYLLWGVGHFVLSVARIARYARIQRDMALLLFCFVCLFQSTAFLLATLLNAPHPLFDFTWIKPYARLAWAMGLPFFLLAVHFEAWTIAHIIYERAREK